MDIKEKVWDVVGWIYWRRGTCGILLWTQWWTFGLHKCREYHGYINNS